MRPANIANNKAQKLFGFEKVPLAAGLNMEAVTVAKATPCAAYFLSSKYKGVLSSLLSGNINGTLSASCCSAIALCLARS